MLGKLLKYEFLSSYRTLLPLYLALLLVSIVFQPITDMGGGMPLEILALVYVALLVAMGVVSFLTVLRRFHSTMYGRESYLMHTLPVSMHTRLAANLLMGLSVYVSGWLVGMLSLSVFVLRSDMLWSLWRIFDTMFYYFLNGLNGVFYVQLLVYSLLSLTVSVLVAYLAVAVGQLAAKAKAVAGVITFVLLTSLNNHLFSYIWKVSFQRNAFMLLNNFMGVLLLVLVVAACYYGILHYLLTKKLNVE